MRDPLLLVQPRGHVLDSEPLAALSQAAHLDQRVGEVAVLLGIGIGQGQIRARILKKVSACSFGFQIVKNSQS